MIETAPRCIQCGKECPYGLKKYPELIICHNLECPNYGLFQVGQSRMNAIHDIIPN